MTVTSFIDAVLKALGLTHRGVKAIEGAFSEFENLIALAEKGAQRIAQTKLANQATREAAAAAYREVLTNTINEDEVLTQHAARGLALAAKVREFIG